MTTKLSQTQSNAYSGVVYAAHVSITRVIKTSYFSIKASKYQPHKFIGQFKLYLKPHFFLLK